MGKKKVDPAAAKEAANPLTRKPANSYTKVTNRDLPEPTRVHPLVINEKKRDRAQAKAREYKSSGAGDAPLGYRLPPGQTEVGPNGEDVHTPAMDPKNFAWLTGAHHMFPNAGAEAGTPAINEPHEVHPGVTAQRRAEDLSGPEYRKALAIATQHGHGQRNPLGSLVETQATNLRRVISEHVRAGVNESASQMFYGGRDPSTRIPDPEMQKVHNDGVMAGRARYTQAVSDLADSPELKMNMPRSTTEEREHIAHAVMSQNVADTSPQNKYRTSKGWPNVEAAEEAAHAGLEGRAPRMGSGLGAGYTENMDKAAARTVDIVAKKTGDVHAYGDPKAAAKTVAFRGAVNHVHSPDAFTTTDVMEATQATPWGSTQKSTTYIDPHGNKTAVHPDTPKSDLPEGSVPMRSKGKIVKGESQVEEPVSAAPPLYHALNDRAHRQVAADYGLSRGVNYADNVHPLQAAPWGSSQMRQPAVNVSHADQYPVVRNWGAEGHAELTGLGRSLFGGPDAPAEHGNLGEQWVRNPNTSNTAPPLHDAYPPSDPAKAKRSPTTSRRAASPAPSASPTSSPAAPSQAEEMPEGKERMAYEAASSAIQRNVHKKQFQQRVHGAEAVKVRRQQESSFLSSARTHPVTGRIVFPGDPTYHEAH